MLSEHERRILDEIEVSLERGAARKRARRDAVVRAARLVIAVGLLAAAASLAVTGAIAGPPGIVLVAVTGLLAGAQLRDATRQWRTEIRRLWRRRRA